MYISSSAVITLLLVTRYFRPRCCQVTSRSKDLLSSAESMRNMFGLCLTINLHEPSRLLWLAGLHRRLAALSLSHNVCVGVCVVIYCRPELLHGGFTYVCCRALFYFFSIYEGSYSSMGKTMVIFTTTRIFS